MADETLAELHAQAVAWRHGRFTELMQHDNFRALFGRLLMRPSTRPLTQETARFLIRHATLAQSKAGS